MKLLLKHLTEEQLFGLLSAIVNRSADGFCFVAADTSFLYVNPAACKFWGRSREELETLTWPEITHPDDLELDLELSQKVLEGSLDSYDIAKRYLMPDGSYRLALLTVYATGVKKCPLVAVIKDARKEHVRRIILRKNSCEDSVLIEAIDKLTEELLGGK